MKKRLHGKEAGIAILIALIIISLIEVIFRAVRMTDIAFTMSTPNFGEQLATIIFASAILIMTAQGKDRVCYILYGAWAGYFVLDQLFEFPGYISNLINLIGTSLEFKPLGVTVMILYAISMIGIIAIGALLVEYMNDGTIYNKAFNIICIITFLAIILPVFGDAWHILMQGGDEALWLSVFNNLKRGTMIFLFTFFAYDSAKEQLKKTDLSK